MKLKFPRFIANTQVEVYTLIAGDDGMTQEMVYSGPCIFDERSRTTLTADKQLITLAAKVVIEGDILPGQDIRGKVQINGVSRVIAGSQRPRNPDGSVFSTELDLA